MHDIDNIDIDKKRSLSAQMKLSLIDCIIQYFTICTSTVPFVFHSGEFSETSTSRREQPQKKARSLNQTGFKKAKNCTFSVAKTRALISVAKTKALVNCQVTVKLIWIASSFFS